MSPCLLTFSPRLQCASLTHAFVTSSKFFPFCFTHPVPPTEEMQGALRTYSKSFSRTAPKQKSATSARMIDPASPSITLITPVAGPTPNPPGRTRHHSRSDPGPLMKSLSWLFLSAKMSFMTVYINTLKKRGACFSESPAPIEDTTATLFTPFSLIASITFFVPAVNIDFPTSFVLPPKAITTPSTSPFSNTFLTSFKFVTSPWNTARPSFFKGCPARSPPEPCGMHSFAGSLTKAATLQP
mmetsp:Transcript_31673/g.62687  ORF Transcript_31673/g.62687 Transcript_31673/m.62687 type:complete len:241 (-) Transcript_31673:272-994(-)